MPSILKQRHFIVSKIFEITDKSLIFKQKTPFSYIENEFTFEELGTKVIHQKKAYIPGLVGGTLAFLVSIIVFLEYLNNSNDTPLYVVLSCIGVCAFLFLFSYFVSQNLITIYLFNGIPLSFFGNSPSMEEVKAFVSTLFEEQKKYLVNRYAKYDPYLPIDQINANLKWLWDRKFIDDNELNELRVKLLPRPGNADSVGFKINPSSN